MLMAVLAFIAIIAAIAPAALAGRSEVYFSDVNGTPKTEWRVGEVLFITVVSHDENRDSSEVEFIDARSRCETHTQVPVPCVEIWDPNTKDSESNYKSLILVETGINTGIFRNQTGILIRPIEFDPPQQENGTLEVFHGDVIMVRYQAPGDDTDIDLDQAKITATPSKIRITDQAGMDVPVWNVGQQIWITVEDPDQNVDPLKPDMIKGVTLWSPRCVWDVIERQGEPRPDQPQPKPCHEEIAPFAYDSQLKEVYPRFFEDSLVLYETGPNTGVFRNVNGITLRDQLGPRREFPGVPTALSLFVNHKDTIVAFYRKPAIVGVPPVPPPPPPPPPVETRTDSCPASPLFDCSRTVPVQVRPGATFNVELKITTKQAMKLIALREQAPAGFSFGRIVQATPTPEAISTDGALRAAWNGAIPAGQTITLIYELIAGPTPGTFKIRGFFTGAPFTIVPLVSDITVAAGSSGQGLSVSTARVSAQGETAEMRITRQVPAQASVGVPFSVTLTVTAKVALPAVSVKENFDGLTLVDMGTDFIGVEDTTLRGLMIQPAAGTTKEFRYKVQCPREGTFTITGTAESRGIPSATETSTITCVTVGPPPPPPPVVPIFRRGLGSPNDPQDFALAQAKVGHYNPAKIKFSDINGRELTEFSIGTEFFITLEDPDQNVDSDHVESVCVQVFDVNGGREGDTPGVFRQLQAQLKDDPRACLEDHVRDLFMWKTGVKLVETGTNTGVFRNPDALKIIGICAQPEAKEEPFNTDPTQTANIQIHKLVPAGVEMAQLPGVLKDDAPQWWAEPSVKVGTVLKDCYWNTPFVEEARKEAPVPYDPTDPEMRAIKTFAEDVPHKIAVYAGDVVYVVFQDQLVDPHDVTYATARVKEFRSFGTVQFVDETGAPVDTYKVGQDVFIKLVDHDRNVNPAVVDKLTILVLDRDSGDWENVLLEETGADTGEFMNRAGLSLQPAIRPDVIRINNNRLEVFDRDTIEAHYQDNYNPKDYSAAWIRLIPQPLPGPVPPPPPVPSRTTFTDAQGREVAEYTVGDTVYVLVEDVSMNVNPNVAETIKGAITVTNVRTGQKAVVDATETGPNTAKFLSTPITTGAPGTPGVMLEVEDSDWLEAKYVDPVYPADQSQDRIHIVTAVFSCRDAKFTIAMTFMAIGSGIVRVSVNVYDLAGRLVAMASGTGNQAAWDGRSLTDQYLAGGIYLYQLTCYGRLGEEATVPVKKLVLVR